MRITRPRATKISQITIDSDLNLGAYSLKFTDLVLKQGNVDTLYVRNVADLAYKDLKTNIGYAEDSIKTPKVDEYVADAGVLVDGVECKDNLVAAAYIGALPTSKITSGQFGLVAMPRGIDDYVIRGTGAGTDPAYEALTLTVTTPLDVLKENVSGEIHTMQLWRSTTIPDTAEKVIITIAEGWSGTGEGTSILYAYYKGALLGSVSATAGSPNHVNFNSWAVDAEGGGLVELKHSLDIASTRGYSMSVVQHMKVS